MERADFRWVILATVYLAMVAFAVAFHAVPPVLSLIMDELGLSHAQGGLLMGVFALPGIVVGILAGMLADRYGIKIVGAICLALMTLGTLLTALSEAYSYLLLGRTITGVGGMAITVNLFRLLSQWFMGKEMGLAMGIFGRTGHVQPRRAYRESLTTRDVARGSALYLPHNHLGPGQK